MCHAYRMSSITAAEVTALATVLGAGVGFSGTALVSWRQNKRMQAESRARAIEETLVSADELLNGIMLYNTVGGTRLMIYQAAASAVTGGIKTGTELRSQNSTFSWSVLFTALAGMAEWAAREISPRGVFPELIERTSTRYLALVNTPRQRFAAAIAPLILANDQEIAEAADGLAYAASAMTSQAAINPRQVNKSIAGFQEAIRSFHATVQLKDKHSWLRPWLRRFQLSKPT